MSEKLQEEVGTKSLKNEQVLTGKKGRTRVFACVVYPDSAPADWLGKLTEQHVPAFVSPLHDMDENPDGSAKKAHWHVMLMFEGVKSQEQVDEMLDEVLGQNRVKHYEKVNSTRGYARYLCHMDNPEKAQYDKSKVRCLSGADYEEVIALPSDDWAVLEDIFDYLEESGELYYSRFINYCRHHRRDWFKLLMKRYSYVVIQWLKSEGQARRDELVELAREGYQVDESTGELKKGGR